MNPLKLSAQFAAYVWYTEVRKGTKAHDEALRFAEQNWPTFLPAAHEGLGRLLVRAARPRRAESGRLPRHMRGVQRVVRVG